MYSNTKSQYGRTPGTAKRMAPKRPAPKPPVTSTDPVEVYCRIRPLDSPDGPRCVKIAGPDSIILTVAENSHAARNGGLLKETKYTFKQVFDELCPQKAVFEQVALPLVEDVLNGKNALLFAYGITSSGKTYTMMGEPQDPGILPRCLDVIFNSIGDLQAKKYVFKPDKMNGFEVQSEADAMLERQERDVLTKINNMNNPKTPSSRDRGDDHNNSNNRRRDRSRVADIEEDNSYAIFLSYVEIYNKYIYDLLEELEYDPITVYKPPTSKGLREDNNHNMYVSGVVEVEVKSTEEAYEVLERGQRKRRVAATSLNAESSRSHSVLNIRIVQAPLDNMGQEVLKDKICVSQLSLVDLAGSERAARTGNQGDRIREAGNINNALMHLRTCLEVLRENQRTGENKYVPYRYDRMTHLFKNYFDGEGKVRMIVCINPSGREYDETVNVMKFAMMTQEVQVARSEKKEFDLGLIHGRRQLKDKLHQEAEKAAADAAIPQPTIFSFAPFPAFEVLQYDNEDMLPELARYLQDRINQRRHLIEDYSQEEAAFRAHLVDIEQEHNSFKMRIQEQEDIIKSKDSDIARLEKKIRNLERANESLSRKTNSLERAKNSLEREVGEREWQLQMAVTEKNRLEQDNRQRLNRMERNCNKRIEESKTKVNEDAMARLKSHENKLAKVRNLLESDAESVYTTPLTTRSGSRYMAKSETDLTQTGKAPVPTPRNPQRPLTRQGAATRTPRGGVPPPTKPKPSVKLHRRSKSSHEVYLAHKPKECTDPKSLLTPNVKKTRSVTKLEAKDMRGVDKYLLTCMDVDSEGDVATKLYKGDVYRTSTGGKSVVLNDVEVVKHKSPGDKKRKSDEFCDDLEDSSEIQDRCRIAVEGHGHLKRVKHSQV